MNRIDEWTIYNNNKQNVCITINTKLAQLVTHIRDKLVCGTETNISMSIPDLICYVYMNAD